MKIVRSSALRRGLFLSFCVNEYPPREIAIKQIYSITVNLVSILSVTRVTYHISILFYYEIQNSVPINYCQHISLIDIPHPISRRWLNWPGPLKFSRWLICPTILFRNTYKDAFRKWYWNRWLAIVVNDLSNLFNTTFLSRFYAFMTRRETPVKILFARTINFVMTILPLSPIPGSIYRANWTKRC